MGEQIGSAQWMDQWFASQREAWTRLFPALTGGVSTAAAQFAPNPLLALGTDVPPSAQDAARKMLQISESFLSLSRDF